jgi:pimeloyl-ACP methyl ester carboxylesterase
MAEHDEVVFDSGGADVHGWHFAGAGDSLDAGRGRPVVVMAHGLGGTKDSGLAPFAEGLAKAGLDVLAFDYRGFGESAGEPRQRVDLVAQLEDYRAAMAAAGSLPGVDRTRLVLWGVSLAGGHVLAAGAHRDDVAAVVALTPLVDGLAAARLALRHHAPSSIARSTVSGLRSRLSSLAGRAPVMMPLVGRPGEVAALSLPGHYESYHAVAGPTWRNEIDASVGMQLGGHRPARDAKHLRCPLLVQIADFDRSAPPHASAKAAFKGRAEVRHYPCDHFDVLPGAEWFEPALAHQVSFLTRHLANG